MDRPLISVVIPVYRGAAFLEELHRRLATTLEAITPAYELVFVDDCSVDDSWAVLTKLAEGNAHTRLVRLMKNHGQQRAVLCGLEHAQGEFVVTIDEDLQHRPEEIALLYNEIRSSDADVVVGRFENKKHGFVRGIGTRVVKWVASVTIGVPRDLDLTSFRIIRRKTVDEVLRLRNTNPVVGFLLYHVTHRFKNVVVNHDPRRSGKSGYTFKALVDYFLCMIIDYSDLPLRAVGYFGFGSAVMSVVLGVYYLQLYVRHRIGVAGFPTIVLLIILFSGLILMSLGIIGSYLLRILQSANVTRMYAVRDRVGFTEAESSRFSMQP
ncbi:MAG: glycosyltransferase family 2 protein [Myxococcales bacterium]|nr:glycosyltransferase family 2 protein [Myxococcales bacterium]